jgi:RimJ/RimL family protein N-acetyltransferase
MKAFLETERLILRPFTEDDVDNLFALDSDPDVVKFATMTGKPTEYTVIKKEILPRFIRYHEVFGNYSYWAVIEKSSQEFIGWIHFRPNLENPAAPNIEEIELGYRFKKSTWGKGYATEGARELICKGFTEWNVKRVIATALVENIGSVRVMEKVGLKFEKYYIESRYQAGNQQAVKYSCDLEDFLGGVEGKI